MRDMDEAIQQGLPERIRAVADPRTGLALASANVRATVSRAGEGVAVSLAIGYPMATEDLPALREAVAAAVAPLPLAGFEVVPRIAAHAPQPNVALSPHVAGITEDSAHKMAVGAAQGVVDALQGTKPDALLNPEVWDRRRR